MKNRRKGNTDKGQRLVRLAKAAFEARGVLVETAPNVVQWIPVKPGLPGGQKPALLSLRHDLPGLPGRQKPVLRPISTRHDLFGIWDMICVGPEKPPGGVRFFVQVTVAGELAHRRAKILASGFPHSGADYIAAYYPGRNRHFRLYRGGSFHFEHWGGDTLVPPPDPKSPRQRVQAPPGAAIEREVAV